MNIIGTGLSGLVGSRVVEILRGKHVFRDLSLETGVDITNYDVVKKAVRASEAPWMFHFAAYTDVQGAEKEKNLGEHSVSWKINVDATQNIVEAVRETGKKLVYVDTDYAFDGKKKNYTEEDAPNPQGWYAKTKHEGAKRVLSLGERALVFRIANPYRAYPGGVFVGKKDFVHKMLERLSQGLSLAAATDQLFVPTFVDDIAAALNKCMETNAHGLYHVVGSSAISPFDAACMVARIWEFSPSLVTKTTFAEFFQNRAPIPRFAALANDKIRALGVHMRTFEEGLREVKEMEYNG